MLLLMLTLVLVTPLMEEGVLLLVTDEVPASWPMYWPSCCC